MDWRLSSRNFQPLHVRLGSRPPFGFLLKAKQIISSTRLDAEDDGQANHELS